MSWAFDSIWSVLTKGHYKGRRDSALQASPIFGSNGQSWEPTTLQFWFTQRLRGGGGQGGRRGPRRREACGVRHIFPGMISIYEWKGARETADEVAMIIKTRASLAKAVLIETKRLHPYESRPCSCCRPQAAATSMPRGSRARRRAPNANERAGLRPRHRSGDDKHARHRVRPRGAGLRRRAQLPLRISIRSRARSSTTRRDLAALMARRARSLAAGRAAPLLPSASPISAKRRWSGSETPDKPVDKAIVWQDRRTAPLCAELEQEGGRRACRAK